jgi:hypothetical protein
LQQSGSSPATSSRAALKIVAIILAQTIGDWT